MNFKVAVCAQKGYIVPFKIKEQRANREVFPCFFYNNGSQGEHHDTGKTGRYC